MSIHRNAIWHSTLENDILEILNENRRGAYSAAELYRLIYKVGIDVAEIITATTRTELQKELDSLCEREKIRQKTYEHRSYYHIEDGIK